MSQFFTDLFNSIFTPGPTPTLIVATNVSFAALQFVLLGLLIATYSVHPLILSIICAGLWWAINWFVSELNAAKAKEGEAHRHNEIRKERSKSTDDSGTETEAGDDSSGPAKRQPLGKTASSGSENEQRRESDEAVLRKRRSMGDTSAGDLSTDSEWDKVEDGRDEEDDGRDATAVLILLPTNGTFERKQITVPHFPEVLTLGRQTNQTTVPTPLNGYFDSSVLSRQHAEVWTDGGSRIWIRDVKSFNGTFVNGVRLSPENCESEPRELREHDVLEMGLDIPSEDQKGIIHHRISAKVGHVRI